MPNTSFLGGIQRREPHILTVYGKHPFYLDPSQKGIWRRGMRFDEDEELLQYLSFRQPFNDGTILKPIYDWNDGNGGIAKHLKAQHSGRKLPDQGSEKQTRSVENKESSTAGQSNEIFVAKDELSGSKAPKSSVDVPGSGPVQDQSGSWIMNTIASLSKGTGERLRKKISLADYKTRPRAGQQSRMVSGKSGPMQVNAMAGVDEGKVGKKRPIEDVVGSEIKDTTDMDTPYPDAKRVRSFQKLGAIPNVNEKEPHAAMNAWAAPKFNSMGTDKTTQSGAAARNDGEQIFREKQTVQRNYGAHQPSGKEKPCVTAAEASAKAVGLGHEASARKRPLEDVTGTGTSTAEPAIKKRAIGERKQIAVDHESISSEPKILAPKKTQPNRSAPKNIGSVRPLPPLSSTLPSWAEEDKILAAKKTQSNRSAPKNIGSVRPLLPLLSPTLPDWVEEEVTKQKAFGNGAGAPRSNLAPLWTDQEFGENLDSTSVTIGELSHTFGPGIHASKKFQRSSQTPENTVRARRDLPPLLSPTLPGWIEAEVTKRKIAGAKKTPTNQQFSKDTAASTSSITGKHKRQYASKEKDTAVDRSRAQSKPNQSRTLAAPPKASKSNLYIEYLRRTKRFM